MNVYVESNFVLEVVLEQPGAAACADLIELAERRLIKLRMPAYALLEPEETIWRRTQEWKGLADAIDGRFREFGRTESLRGDADKLVGVTLRAVARALEHQRTVRERIMRVADVIPVGGPTLRFAERLRRAHALRLPDAVMLASVLIAHRATGGEAIFANANKHDFADPKIKRKLKKRGCPLVTRFEDALGRVKASLPKATS